MSYRETIRALLDALDLDKREAEELERDLSKAAIVALMASSFTIAMAAEALGIPDSTAKTWARKDPDFEARLEAAKDVSRAWVVGMLRLHLMDGGKAAAAAANILSNLSFPELRERNINAKVSGAPDPDKSAANLAKLEAMLGRGD